MNGKFTHYLITRYNVNLDNWDTDSSGHSTKEKEWMQHRFELFSRYCLPSVLAQSVKDFQWLIYFEDLTPEDRLLPIRSLVAQHSFIHLRFIQGYSGCMKDIDQQLSLATTPYVITSRVDNDDGLGIDYMKIVQSQFTPQDKTLITLLHGYSYNPITHVVTRLYKMQKNHFSSFIEEHRAEGGHISVRGFPHNTPPASTKLIEIDSKYSWLKVFHERNLLSSPFGYPVFSDGFSRHFGIDEKYLNFQFSSTLRYSISWLKDGINRKILKRTSVNK